MLIEIDSSPHVLRYYAKEADSEFVYLALAYCPLNLNSLIECKFDLDKSKEGTSEKGLLMVEEWSGSFSSRLELLVDILRGFEPFFSTFFLFFFTFLFICLFLRGFLFAF